MRRSIALGTIGRGSLAMVGEFLHIERFIRAFRLAGGSVTNAEVPIGPGDDAAVIKVTAPLAVTTDGLFENVHFRPGWGTWEQVGHKALAVNLSDLAAMGARPLAFICALGLPAAFRDDALVSIAQGMARLSRRFGVILAGGNFSRASEVSITITALGELDHAPLRRDGARVGDSLLLVGELGVAAAELHWLRQGRVLPQGRSALLEPEPLVEAGLVASSLARCAIDISDGLAQDMGHVARASAHRLRIDYLCLPRSDRFASLTSTVDEAERARLLLAGGEDYALVIAASPEHEKRLCRDVPAVVIGSVEAGEGVVIDHLPPGVDLRGHDHFLRADG